MSPTQAPTTTRVVIAGRRTPLVLAVARCLREGIERGGPRPPSDATAAGTVSLVSTTDAQCAHVTFTESEVIVGAGASDAADLAWSVRWSDPIPDKPPTDDFGQYVYGLLAGDRGVDWRTAADAFWSRAAVAAGMPTGLLVYCVDDESQVSVGEPTAEGYGVLGTAAALTRFFAGRSTLIEALESGEFGINLSFPVFSALVGANLKVVCGEL